MADSIVTPRPDSGESDFPLSGKWVAPAVPVFRPYPFKLYLSDGDIMALAVAYHRAAQQEPNPVLYEYYTQKRDLLTRLSEPGFDPTVEPPAAGNGGRHG